MDDKPEIEELELTSHDGSIRYVYIAKINGKWVDLAPYGNCLPEDVTAQ